MSEQTTDLYRIKWLRETASAAPHPTQPPCNYLTEIAERLEALAAENAKLREALETIVAHDEAAVSELKSMGIAADTTLIDLAREALKGEAMTQQQLNRARSQRNRRNDTRRSRKADSVGGPCPHGAEGVLPQQEFCGAG